MEGIAIVVADFDGVTYHLSNPDDRQKNKILISISMGFWKDLVPHGVMDVRGCERFFKEAFSSIPLYVQSLTYAFQYPHSCLSASMVLCCRTPQRMVSGLTVFNFLSVCLCARFHPAPPPIVTSFQATTHPCWWIWKLLMVNEHNFTLSLILI